MNYQRNDIEYKLLNQDIDDKEGPCYNCIVKMLCKEHTTCSILLKFSNYKLHRQFEENNIKALKRQASYNQAFTKLFRRR
jgi:hypothetical protein